VAREQIKQAGHFSATSSMCHEWKSQTTQFQFEDMKLQRLESACASGAEMVILRWFFSVPYTSSGASPVFRD
jgi:hypothetical protein